MLRTSNYLEGNCCFSFRESVDVLLRIVFLNILALLILRVLWLCVLCIDYINGCLFRRMLVTFIILREQCVVWSDFYWIQELLYACLCVVSPSFISYLVFSACSLWLLDTHSFGSRLYIYQLHELPGAMLTQKTESKTVRGPKVKGMICFFSTCAAERSVLGAVECRAGPLEGKGTILLTTLFK